MAALVLVTALPALAQPLDIRPGLWEVSVQRSGTPVMPEMSQMPPEMLAQLPPAQRAQIEAMMRTRRTVAPGVQAHKVCVTQASLEKTPDFGMAQQGCTRTKDVRSAGGWQVQEVCRSGGNRQTLDIRYEVVDRQTIRGTVKVAISDGADLTMTQEMHGRWLAVDCGDVKPLE